MAEVKWPQASSETASAFVTEKKREKENRGISGNKNSPRKTRKQGGELLRETRRQAY